MRQIEVQVGDERNQYCRIKPHELSFPVNVLANINKQTEQEFNLGQEEFPALSSTKKTGTGAPAGGAPATSMGYSKTAAPPSMMNPPQQPQQMNPPYNLGDVQGKQSVLGVHPRRSSHAHFFAQQTRYSRFTVQE